MSSLRLFSRSVVVAMRRPQPATNAATTVRTLATSSSSSVAAATTAAAIHHRHHVHQQQAATPSACKAAPSASWLSASSPSTSPPPPPPSARFFVEIDSIIDNNNSTDIDNYHNSIITGRNSDVDGVDHTPPPTAELAVPKHRKTLYRRRAQRRGRNFHDRKWDHTQYGICSTCGTPVRTHYLCMTCKMLPPHENKNRSNVPDSELPF